MPLKSYQFRLPPPISRMQTLNYKHPFSVQLDRYMYHYHCIVLPPLALILTALTLIAVKDIGALRE